MCIIFWAHRSRGFGYRFVLAANRDEFVARPTQPAHFWANNPDVLSGVDMQKGVEGGTWLGMTRTGRFAALTNYRVPTASIRTDAIGRGGLCSNYLTSNVDPTDYLNEIAKHGPDYNGFNLLVGDLSKECVDSGRPQMHCYSNMEDYGVKSLPQGTYGVCNRILDYPWPKLRDGKDRFANILAEADRGLPADDIISKLTDLMNNEKIYPDSQLPQTGVPIEFERQCSSIFLDGRTNGYGTVSTTLILVSDNDVVTYVERFLDRTTLEWSTISRFDFPLQR
eukprot:comp6535_c0_seq1/m.2305 comp6535_c0_seq1/g.2305  ORF comp6535_c0_seq1/g.2305 comp6535_c0_seq1/m.2305 type:complete len:280 (-) comp6535_c0_seq1:195-1034(-)